MRSAFTWHGAVQLPHSPESDTCLLHAAFRSSWAALLSMCLCTTQPSVPTWSYDNLLATWFLFISSSQTK